MKFVQNSFEFITEIKNKAHLSLLPKEYNLDVIAPPYNRQVYFRDTYTGNELVARNLEDLRIIGQEISELTTASTYSCVLCFEDSKDIIIENIKMGHSPELGECTGDVITFKNCKDLRLVNLDIYGCGATGLSLDYCTNVTIDNCTIRDCTDTILRLTDCESVVFDHCRFVNNKSKAIILSHSDKIFFNDCTIQGNTGNWFYRQKDNKEYVFYPVNSCGLIEINNCEIDDHDITMTPRLLTLK